MYGPSLIGFEADLTIDVSLSLSLSLSLSCACSLTRETRALDEVKVEVDQSCPIVNESTVRIPRNVP